MSEERLGDEQIKDFLTISEIVAPEPWEPILLDTEDSLNRRVAALNYVDGCISEGGEDFYLVIAENAGGDVCHTGNGPTSKTNAIFIAQARALLPSLAREVLDRRAAEAAARAGADPDEIGRRAHEAWKRWRVEAGYPDHPFPYWHERDAPLGWRSPRIGDGAERVCTRCERGESAHHDDIVNWADLRPEKKQKYIVQGMAGYESGRAAAQAEVRELQAALAETEKQRSYSDEAAAIYAKELDAAQAEGAGQVEALKSLFRRHMRAEGFTESAIEAGLREAALANDSARGAVERSNPDD